MNAPRPLKDLPQRTDVFTHLVSVVVLLVVGISAYRGTLGAPLVFDDVTRIVNNPAIQSPLNFGAIWESFPTRFVAMWTFALNFWWDTLNPESYHVVNIAIHLACGVVIYALLQSLSVCLGRGATIYSVIAAQISAAIFLLHPVQTQAVTYVVQRMTSLCTLFSLSAMLLFLRFRCLERDGAKRGLIAAKAGSLLFLLLALLTKEIAIVIPVALLLLDTLLFSDERRTFERVRTLLPWVVLSMCLPLIVLTFEGTPAQDLPKEPGFAWRYWLTQPSVFWRYLELIVWPSDQNLDYDFPLLSTPDVKTFAVLALLGCLGYVAFRLRKEKPLITLGILFFFLGLVLESLAPLPDLIFEHRLYLPMVGLAIAIYGLFLGLPLFLRPWGVAFGGLVLIACVALTVQRNAVWSNGLSLWKDTTAKSPNKFRPHLSLSWANLREGLFEEAEAVLMGAERLATSDTERGDLFYNLALSRYFRARIPEALAAIELAERSAPDDPKVLAFAAELNLRSRPERAADYLRRALTLDPDRPESNWTACKYHLFKRDYEAAVKRVERLMKRDLGDFLGAVLYARALLGAGRRQEARGVLKQLDEKRTTEYRLQYELGKAFKEFGDVKRAELYFQMSLRNAPQLRLAEID